VHEIETTVCNMLQDMLNKLYAASSITDRATMCQLKNDFYHHIVSTDVMMSFNYTDNFIRFTTGAELILCTCCRNCTSREMLPTKPDILGGGNYWLTCSDTFGDLACICPLYTMRHYARLGAFVCLFVYKEATSQ